MAICFTPAGVLTRSMMSGGNSECICRGSLSSLSFHCSFISFTLDGFRIFSSFCQAVRWELPPSVSQSAPQIERRLNAAVITRSRRIINLSENTQRALTCAPPEAETGPPPGLYQTPN